MKHRDQGLTVIELLVVVALVAIGLAVTGPSLSHLFTDQRLTADINRLIGTLHMARRAAITSGEAAVVCPGTPTSGCLGGNRWERGWLAFRDPEGRRDCVDTAGDGRCDHGAGIVLQATPELGASAELSGTGNLRYRVVYKPSGFADGYAGRFNLCNRAPDAAGRGITLALNGRIRPSRPGEVDCP